MATITGGTALAERPTESVWLAKLPTPRHVPASDTLPVVRAAAHPPVSRLAEGTLTGLSGAVTDLACSRDGRHLVAAHYGADAVSMIDTATLTTSATVSGIAEPYAVAAADRAYLRSASIAEDGVVAVDLNSAAALAARTVGVGAGGLAVGPTGEVLYVARSADDVADIAVVDVESGKVSAIPVIGALGAAIDALGINAAGTRLYAALTTAAGGALAVIDISTSRVRIIPVGATISDIAVHGDDRRVFVTGWDPSLGSVVQIVDTAASRVTNTTEVNAVPVGIVACGGGVGGGVYVAHGEQIAVLDAANLHRANQIEIGRPVSCLAVSRDGSRLYAGDYDGGITALAVPALAKGLRAAS